MSKGQKRKFKWATFTIFPLLLIIAALVPIYLSVSSQANALNVSQWETVRGYIAEYFGGPQYNAGLEGEAGFRMNKTDLWNRIDSNGDISPNAGTGIGSAGTAVTGALSEGDDMAARPVIVDNLMTNTGVIPGTDFRCNYNTNESCFSDTSITSIRQIVDNHQAAGFSTDIIDYCVSAHTAAPTVGGFGIIAQVPGALASDTSLTPNVYTFEYARNGWRDSVGAALVGTGVMAAPETSAGGFAAPGTVANCNAAATDYDLVRCQANWAIASTGGNVGNGQTIIATIEAAAQSVDIRVGAASTISSAGTNLQIPINTLFSTTGLANLDPLASTVMVSRTQMGGDAAIGLEMLGYNNIAGGFINGGVSRWNSTGAEQQVDQNIGLPLQSITAFAAPGPVDTTGPGVTSVGSSNVTTNSADITRVAGEPATMKVEYGTSPGVYTNTANDTVLNASKTVSLTGLSSYTTYYYRVTSYDGYANGTVSTEASFQTLDTTGPMVSNVYPADGANLNDITSLVISADYSDSGSGVDTASVMVHLDISNMLMDCPIQTSSHVECIATAGDLALGTHPLDVYVTDLAGNETINRTYFTVVDTASPSVSYTGPSGNINDNTPTVTGTYSDPAPSSGIAGASLSLDGGSSFPYSCSAVGGAITCNVTPAIADAAYGSVVIRVADSAGNPAGTATGSFTVDTSVPVIGSILPSGWILTGNPATVNATLSDTGSGINTAAGSIQVDGSPLGSCTVTGSSISCDTSAAGFAEGAHTILVTAYDLAGNTQTGGGSFSVDSAGPLVSNIQPSGAIGTNSTTVSADYSDLTSGIDQATVTVSLDTVAMTGCTVGAGSVSCPATGLADGPHAIAVSVDDVAGNNSTGNGSFSVDTAAPTVTPDTLGYQPGNWTGDTTPNVSATISGVPGGSNISAATVIFDKGTGNEYACSGGEITYSNTTVSCTPATARTEGLHAVEFTAEYSLNHPGSGTTDINIDTTAPSVTNVLPGGNLTVNSTTISGDYSDAGSGIDAATAMVHVDGSMIMSGCTISGTSISCPKSGLSDGTHNIEIIVDDHVGNTQTGIGVFNVDTNAPSVTNLAPSGLVSSTSPTVSGDYTDGSTGINSATAQITMDGGAPLAGCTATDTGISCPTSGLAQGAHDYTVSVNDVAGNLGSSSGSFTIDTVAPTFSNTTPGSWTGDTTPIIAFRINDGTSNANKALTTVSLDGTPIDVAGSCSQTGTDPVEVACTVPALAEGPHTVNVSSTDNNGNSDSTSWSFDLDLSGPSISNSGPSGDITDSTPTITADISDAVAGLDQTTLYVSVDGTMLNSCIWNSGSISCDVGAVSAGTHNAHIEILDMAGNLAGADWQFTLTQQNYYFPWYDNDPGHGMGGDWVMISNLGGVDADVKIYVGDISDAATPVAQYTTAGGNAIAPNDQVHWSSDSTLANGPVRVVSTNGQTLLVSQRVLYRDSFNEIMAASESDIDDIEFDFTWYDNDPAHSMGGNWIMVGNIDTAASATADVYIGGVAQETLTIPAGSYRFWKAASTVTDGPVQVISRSGQKLVVSQRVIYKNSFNEVLASEKSSLQDEGFFTWYDSDPAHGMGGDWVMASNMGSTTTDVEIYLNDVGAGATPVTTITGVLPGEAAVWISDTVRTEGPVRVRSTNGQQLMTSQRVVYKSSFEEVQGLTPVQMGTNADFNWYDWQSAGMNGDWILIGNQNALGKDMGISIASTPMVNVGTGTANFPVSANSTMTPSFTGQMNGPVRVNCSSCSAGDKLIISQRVLYKDSFNEVVGRPRG
ncbi:MAG: beta strand repeat-containing protein [Thermoleophilia bacterium]